MAHLAYYRVSTLDQSIESQRAALQLANPGGFDEEFIDEGVSGAVLAAKRPAFAKLMQYARKGDSVFVYSVDRLGRDALDVQQTVRYLLSKGIALEINGLGRIAKGVGELILAVLAQVADMERARILERTEAGRSAAREALRTTGKTHRGKASLGRPVGRVAGGMLNPTEIASWRAANKASIAVTAAHWAISPASVKRYCRGLAEKT